MAAWLWDGGRGRIVWANAPGVALFDGQSVFDLVDRPFDPLESGVQRIRELTQSLASGESQNAALHFPSVGLSEPIECTCWIHALADGRPGLLIVQAPPKPVISEVPSALADDVLAAWPSAVLAVDAEARLIHANGAARQLFDLSRQITLRDVMAAERAERLLAVMQKTTLTSAQERVETVLGRREVKIVGLKPSGSDLTVLLIEDVTDRRALERSLASPAQVPDLAPEPPVAPLAKEQAFEKLAKSMKESLEADLAASAEQPKAVEKTVAPETQKSRREVRAEAKATAKPEAEAGVPPPPTSTIPDAIRMPLENTGEAVIIGRSSTILYVTRKAADLLGLNDPSDVFKDRGLITALSGMPEAAMRQQITLASGVQQDLVVSKSRVPWLNGPAEQFVLRRPMEAANSTAPTAAVMVEQRAPAPLPPPTPEPTARAAPAEPAKPVAAEAKPANPADTREAIANDDIKAILDVASDGIITLDKDGHILSFSAGAESIFGYSIREVVDSPLADLLAPDSRRLLRDYLAALSGPGLASVFNDGREVTAIVKQGGNVPLFLTIGRLQSPRSRALFCAVVRDITTWKRTEKDLLQAKEAAEAASRQKSEFLARISHELRTPLNAIMGFSEVMRLERFGEIKNDKYRAYAHDIHASGSHLLALINDLLDLSKVESGRLELNFAAVNLADVIEHTTRLMEETARQARVVVRHSIAKNLPRVVADLKAMRQVMFNLLSNAIKYTDPGGQVIISAHATEAGEVVLRIKDTGIGMDPSQLRDALEPFTRVETPNRERQGTGLGLPLTKALVEANRATFVLSSELGKGTLSEICFPVTRVLAE